MSRPTVELGIAGLTRPGETESGDRCVVEESPAGFLIAVVDGLGHGLEAARAADSVATLLKRNAGEPIESLVRRAHEDQRGARGVVMSLACIDTSTGTMTWFGVGDVEGLLVREGALAPGADCRLFLRRGILGQSLPRLVPLHLPIHSGDTIIFATDGIRSDFSLEVDARLHPKDLAQRILNRCARGTDDALVVVVRYVGARDESG